jgi:hypothetical protein
LRDICAERGLPSPPDGAIAVELRGGEYAEILLERIEVRCCCVCESPMREQKGKWACSDPSCAMYGKEQKGKR